MSPRHPAHPVADAPAWATPPAGLGVRHGLRRLVAPTAAEIPSVRAWGPWWAGIAAVVAFVAVLLGLEAVLPEGVWTVVALEGAMLVLVAAAVAWRRRELGPAPSALPGTRSRLRWLLGGGIAIVAVATVAGGLIDLVAPMDGIGHKVPESTEGRVAAFLGMALLAPIVEETVFRGWLLRSLATRIAPVAAVAISGTAFGLAHLWLAHYALGMGLELVVVGMALGLLCLHSGSLLPSIAGHMTLNTTAVLSIVAPSAERAIGVVLLLSAIVLAGGWLLRQRRGAAVRRPAAAGT